MQVDREFSRRAGVQAYLIAAFSIVYAIVFLRFVRGNPDDHSAAALAWALIAASSLAATIAVVATAARVNGDARWWLTALGVGYALLSGTHAVFAAIAEVQGLSVGDLSATDPRGFATFGLAGLWTLMLGLEIRSGSTSLPGGLGWLALIAGLDLIILFAATVARNDQLILVTAGLAGIVLVPLFWIWTGRALRA